MTQDWRGLVAAERMELDSEFTDRVRSSALSSQQWSLVMTAVEFEIENPESPTNATIIANTNMLGAVADELDAVDAAAPGGGAPADGGGGGILSRVTDLFGSNDDEERLAEAEDLAGEYTRRLQEKLVANDRWEDVCAHAAGG